MKVRAATSTKGFIFCALYTIYSILYISYAQAQPATQLSATTTTTQAVTLQPAGAVAMFSSKCASCHTIGGGAIGNTPDLLAATAWSNADLEIAIKRMEKNVGPLSATEVTELTKFLKNPQARELLKAAQDALVAQRKATLAPPSAATGRALFFGQQPLVNRGVNCSACHVAGNNGGTLGIDLTHVHARMGETALQSAIQGANFMIMKPAYAAKPITAQEAAHLTAFLRQTHEESAVQTVTARPPWRTRAFGWTGLVIAVLGLLVMTLGLRRIDRGGGVRARLVKQATRSSDR